MSDFTLIEDGYGSFTPAEGGAVLGVYLASISAVVYYGVDVMGTAPRTWLFDGAEFQVLDIPGPTLRSDFGLAADNDRNVVVLYGGGSGAQLSETWEFDGTAWTQVSPVANPGNRMRHRMVYDPVRQEVVLYGGRTTTSQSSAVSTTWVYDGVTWTQRTPVGTAGKRTRFGMVWDDARGEIVLFGGVSDTGADLATTYTWDGTTWTLETPITSPSARNNFPMAYDITRQTVALFAAGPGTNGNPNDTWEWDGSNWILAQTSAAGVGSSTRPTGAHHGGVMEYVPSLGKIVLNHGTAVTLGTEQQYGQVWTWEGATWAELVQSRPYPTTEGSGAYDTTRGVFVTVGGGSPSATLAQLGTWEWNGTLWTRFADVPALTRWQSLAAGYDPVRQKTVAFGGSNQKLSGGTNSIGRSVYEWDGATWTTITAGGPPWPAERLAGFLFWVPTLGKLVLYHGIFVEGVSFFWPIGALWAWDGSDWEMVNADPWPRSNGAIAYDPTLERVVMFGGQFAETDTWEWDGSDWTLINFDLPTPRRSFKSAYDGTGAIIHGGMKTFGGSGTVFDETWRWNGTSWTQLAIGSTPARFNHALAYDDGNGEIVMFGGVSDFVSSILDETWTWNGTAWMQETPSTVPPSRIQHAMAYHAASLQVVMFGGFNSTDGTIGDTWTWDGTDWALAQEENARGGEFASFAYDPVRAVAVYWNGDQTWEFSGTWSVITTASQPSDFGLPMVYDVGQAYVLLLDGYNLETWSYDGVDWTQETPTGLPNFNDCWSCTRDFMAYDIANGVGVALAGEEVILGQVYKRTWLWDGVDWTEQTASGPNWDDNIGWFDYNIAYDATIGAVIMFGYLWAGVVSTPKAYQWDGTEWDELTITGSSPPIREDFAFGYDPDSGTTVLFGGEIPASSNLYDDTWKFDGSSWTQASSVASPVARTGGTPASTATAMLMFGGRAATNLADLWSYEGSPDVWTQLYGLPSPRADHAMAYDSTSQIVAMYGGVGVGTEIWLWDGSGWTMAHPFGVPNDEMPQMAYDTQRDEIVVWSSSGATYGYDVTAETWTLRKVQSAPGVGNGINLRASFDTTREVLVAVVPDGAVQTWEWTPATSTWALVSSLGPPVIDGVLGFDPSDGKTFLLTAGAEHWTWANGAWTQLSTDHIPRRSGEIIFNKDGRAYLYAGRGSGGTLLRIWSDLWLRSPVALAGWGWSPGGSRWHLF